MIVLTFPSFLFFFLLFFCLFVFETESHSVNQARVQGCDLVCNLHPPGSSDSHASATQMPGITGTCDHAWLFFVFAVEMEFCRVGQSGL